MAGCTCLSKCERDENVRNNLKVEGCGRPSEETV